MATCSIKIKTEEVDGVARVNPETMKLLLEMAGHRDVCDECGAAFKGKGQQCQTGRDLFNQLSERPDVEIIPDNN